MCVHICCCQASPCNYFVNSFGCFFYWLIHPYPACCATPRPLHPISMCLKSHLWTEEVRRKGRKGNGILLFVMGRGNMINSHSVCCTLHMALHWCMYRENNKPWTTPHQVSANCDFHYCSEYLKYLVNTFTSILNHAFWPITHKALHNKLGHSFPISTPPISASPKENTPCLLASQACVIARHNNRLRCDVMLTSW